MKAHFYILAIDQGTTSSRAMIFDQDQHLISKAQSEFPQYFPQSGWVEHDPESIWQSVLDCCHGALAKSHVAPKNIRGIGISNQRETTIVWNRHTGRPIGPAIVWQDRRTALFCETLKTKQKNIDQFLQDKTGLLLDPYFSATKIDWLLKNIANARQQAEAGDLLFGTVESFLVWRFTRGKVHVTDISNASRTLLMNIHTGQWDDELLSFFNIPKAMLPTIVNNAEKIAEVDEFFFGFPIPITGMAGDQQAALVGQACINEGMLKATLGTGAFLMLNTGHKVIRSNNQLVSTVAYRINNKITYALEGSIFNVGTIINWLKNELQLIHSPKETETLAESLASNEGVYFVPAFTGLGAPYWRPDARGAIVGLSRNTSKAHIVRAALEAIAYQLRDIQLAMEQDAQEEIQEVRVDGGLTANHWLLQFSANMMNVPLLQTVFQEASCYGAEMLAAVGAGCYEDLAAATKHWQAAHKFLPQLSDVHRDQLYEAWMKAVAKV